MLSDVIELAILGLLKEQDLHGYELKKRLRELLGPLSSVSFGSLYPALARLEGSGAVKAVEAGDEPAPLPMPMTGSLGAEAAAFRAARRRATRTTRGGRGKKVYGITDVGEQRLADLIEEPGEDDRSFTLKLAFGRHLAAEARLALLERRRAVLHERLVEAQRALRDSERRHDHYTRSLMEHNAETTAHDIAWLERLIDAERRPATPTENTGGPNR
jgi:DNA-binding PadR family transcriptional regulator